MEVDSVKVEDEKRLAQLRFEAAVKVIKSLPPDGKCCEVTTPVCKSHSGQFNQFTPTLYHTGFKQKAVRCRTTACLPWT